MTLKDLKILLTSHLNEMASTNSYKVRDKALTLLDTAYGLGVSESKGSASGKSKAVSKPVEVSRSPSRD